MFRKSTAHMQRGWQIEQHMSARPAHGSSIRIVERKHVSNQHETHGQFTRDRQTIMNKRDVNRYAITMCKVWRLDHPKLNKIAHGHCGERLSNVEHSEQECNKDTEGTWEM